MSRTNPPKPPADNSDGRNQYIPSFIAAKPFYADSLDDSDYLQHQRLNAEQKDTLDKAKWYDRGKKSGPAATKYRKGACENCGSASHKTKDCLYRPRKNGAKYTGRDIKADEVVESVSLGWDAKRDRWNGYDAREYSQVVQDYNHLEAIKKTASDHPDDDNQGDQYAEETDMGRSQPTSTRQLRLREDTAKYLVDLNLDSAKYDPKTRSMDTTIATSNQTANEIDVSSGFMRPSEAEAFERAQKYAWETQEAPSKTPISNNSNNNIIIIIPTQQKLHLQANPTEGALLLKKKESADEQAKADRARYLAEKYGDGNNTTTNKLLSSSSTTTTITTTTATITKPPQITTSETYLEYDSAGNIKGQSQTQSQNTKSTAKSKYPEDILTNNHTSVWGSYWKDFTWGYACCHATTRNAYCTGEEGKRAWEEEIGLRMGTGLALIENGAEDGDADKDKDKDKGDGEEGQRSGEEGAVERKRDTQVDLNHTKKRTIEEINSGVTVEDMESYKRNKLSTADPMAQMLGKDHLLNEI